MLHFGIHVLDELRSRLAHECGICARSCHFVMEFLAPDTFQRKTGGIENISHYRDCVGCFSALGPIRLPPTPPTLMLNRCETADMGFFKISR